MSKLKILRNLLFPLLAMTRTGRWRRMVFVFGAGAHYPSASLRAGKNQCAPPGISTFLVSPFHLWRETKGDHNPLPLILRGRIKEGVAVFFLLFFFSVSPLFAVPDPLDSVILESKTVQPSGGPLATMMRVWITNKDSIAAFVLPLEEKSILGGAYMTLSRPRTFGGVVIPLTTTLSFNRILNSTKYHSNSPDTFLVFGLYDVIDPATIEPPNAFRKPFWDIKFDTISPSYGQVQFDSSFVAPSNHVEFVDINAINVSVNFVKSIFTVGFKPVWTPIGNKAVYTGQLLTFFVSATDPDSTVPSLTALQLPPGASFVDNLNGIGQFFWTPAAYQAGGHTILFIASDGVLADTCPVIITVLADTLRSQKNGSGPGDQFGSSVAGGGDAKALGGDVNADGVADYIIGAPGTDPSGVFDAGSAFIYSGRNDSLLYRINGPISGDRVGGSVGLLGDVNGDGSADFIIGAPEADAGAGLEDAGSVFVYSGATGTLLYRKDGAGQVDHFGSAVAVTGNLKDVNGDGRADFIVGAPDANGSRGQVYVYSGATGALLYQKTGGAIGDRVGGSVGISGDVNGDNRADFIVGAADANAFAGQVFVYSGADGSLLYQKDGAAAGDRVGGSVGLTFVQDIDGDGKADFAAGATRADPGGLTDAGSVYVYSGATGTLLFQKNGTAAGERVGGSVGLTGDVNQDGRADLVVGAPDADPGGLTDAGETFLYSGRDGSLLLRRNGTAAGDRVGGSVGIFNDASGQARYVVGAPGASPGGIFSAGSAYIFLVVSKGDMNGDGILTAADVVMMLNCVFLGIGNCGLSYSDITCDGILTASDVVKELNGVFLGSPLNCSL